MNAVPALVVAMGVACAVTPRTPTETNARAQTVAFLAAGVTKIASLEEAQAVLKSDDLAAFPAAVRWAERSGVEEALPLRAQLLLAQGEGEWLLARALERSGDVVLATSFRIVAAEDVAAGLVLADRIIVEAPDTYVGHRIAADAHRLRAQWRAFDEAVAEVERLKPGSNGLRFARAMEAQQRYGNGADARRWLEEAVGNDPGFVRAWVHLSLLQTGDERAATLAKIRTLSPGHALLRANAVASPVAPR